MFPFMLTSPKWQLQNFQLRVASVFDTIYREFQ